MAHTINTINNIVLVVMSILYAYQLVYTLVGLIKRKAKILPACNEVNSYAALICARNEENVIGELIASLKQQTYSNELFDIYVLADNCTDSTAEVAKKAGAHVYIRNNTKKVGKGYALDFLLRLVKKQRQYTGYFIFDADNLIDKNFVREMNKTISCGNYSAVTCYRNSKNFGDNWITAGYSIWFLREARFLNHPRSLFKTSCAISGTGFYVSDHLIDKLGGWPYHMLTEDIQFSVNCAIKGEKIGYCDKAVVYDEQPTSFSQSWSQRLRWSKGFYQIDSTYLLPLIKGAFTSKNSRMACYDMLLTVAPAMLLTITTIMLNVIFFATFISMGGRIAMTMIMITGRYLIAAIVNFYLGMVFYGLLTVISEWKNIHSTGVRKLVYVLTFPLFIATYVPISIVALFSKVEWKPINHYAASSFTINR